MFDLYIFNEFSTNGYSDICLNIFSFLGVLSSILVIVTKNPIVSVLYLIGLFLAIACYLIMIGLNFLGLSYLLVYIGAISILFLFILMLINIRVSELISDTGNSIPLALGVGLCFNNIFYDILPYSIISIDKTKPYFDIVNDKIKYVTFPVWDGNLSETSHITSLGNLIYTNYSIWLIIISLILLLSMIGAIVITIAQPK